MIVAWVSFEAANVLHETRVDTNVVDDVQDLCYAALAFASENLKPNGHFVCKFYQGAEDKLLQTKLKKMFEHVHREKPDSSRKVCAHHIIHSVPPPPPCPSMPSCVCLELKAVSRLTGRGNRIRRRRTSLV